MSGEKKRSRRSSLPFEQRFVRWPNVRPVGIVTVGIRNRVSSNDGATNANLDRLFFSLLLKSLKKLACLMEKEIGSRLETFSNVKSRQLAIFCEQRQHLNETVQTSYEILQQVRRRTRRKDVLCATIDFSVRLVSRRIREGL